MIQNYRTLDAQVKKINQLLEPGAQIQKIYSTVGYICISLRLPGQTQYLYLGKGSNHEGLWLSLSKPISELRVSSKFCQYLRSHLSGRRLNSIEMDPLDRALALNYQFQGLECRLALIYVGRKSYFLDYRRVHDQEPSMFYCWKNEKTPNHNNIFDEFNEVGRRDLQKDGELQLIAIEELLKQEQQQLKSKLTNKKGRRFLKNKKQNILKDLIKCQKWQKLQNAAQDVEDLPGTQYLFEDIKIKFPSDSSFYQKRDYIFQKAKSLKRGLKILERRFQENEKELLTGNFENKPIIQNASSIEPCWAKQVPKKSVIARNLDNIDIFNHDRYKLAVGKNSQANDLLRIQWAKKEDYWFHLDGYKSAHVVVKLNIADYILTEQDYQIIASALAHYSNFQDNVIPVLYTQVKYIKGIKGKAGSVNFKKEKRRLCHFDKDWKIRLST